HLVHPERRAVCFTGGTGFRAALSELPTAIRLRAPIVVVAIPDGTSDAPELVRMGQRFAVPSAAADSEASFAQAFGRALRADGPPRARVRPRRLGSRSRCLPDAAGRWPVAGRR